MSRRITEMTTFLDLEHADARVLESEARVRLLAELSHTEEEFLLQARLLDAVQNAVIATDAEGRIFYWNDHAQSVYGWSRAEVMGRPMHELHLSDLATEEEAELMAHLFQGETWAAEFTGCRRDGTTFPAYYSDSPMMGENGELAGIICVSFDISDRKRAEEALRISESRYRTLVEYQTDLICRFLPDTTLTFVNDAYCKYFGTSSDELLGRRFLDFLPEEEHVGALAQMRSINAENPVLTYEHRVVDAKGEVRWQQWTDRAIFGSNGEIVEYQSTGRDITERKRAEDALRASETRFRAVWDTAVDAMVVSDREGIIQLANPAFYALYGCTPEQAIGKPCWFMFPEEEHEEFRVGYAEIFASPQQAYEIERSLLRADGTPRFINVSASFIIEDGHRTGILSVVRDITYRKLNEQAVQQANEELLHRVGELSTLNRISQVVSTMAYVPSALQAVGKTMVEIFRASSVTISFLDREKQRLMLLTEVKSSADGRATVVESAAGRVITLDEDPLARQAVAEERVIVSYALRSPHYGLMIAPLQAGGNVVGLVAIGTGDRDRSFGPAEIELVQTISGSIAASIETARLLAQEQQHRLIAEGLSEVVAALAGSLDQETVIRTIFEQLQRVVRFSGATLYLRDRKVLVIAEAAGLAAHCIGCKLPLAQELPPQQVFKRKQPLIVSDPSTYPDWQEQDSVGDIGSWMGAPLVIGSKPIGVLAVTDSAPQTYNEQNLHTLQVFAHHAAIAIDNARRFQQAHVVAADEERSRLARELHDSVTQALFSASLISDVLPQLYRNNPAEADSGLETLSKLTHGALAEMRALLLELRPADMQQARLDILIGHLTTAATLQMPVEIKSSLDAAPPLSQKVQMALYRITQEALNNVIKHSRADRVEVTLRTTPPVSDTDEQAWQGAIALTIADNGVGFDQSAGPNGHMGLASMRERARSIKAELRISTEPGQGTRVTLAWKRTAPRYRGVRAGTERGAKRET